MLRKNQRGGPRAGLGFARAPVPETRTGSRSIKTRPRVQGLL